MKRLGLSLVVLAAICCLLAAVASTNTLAVFTRAASVPGNTFSTDTLDPPMSVTATGGGTVFLSWVATADTYASGHRVLRGAASGGPYTQIAQVTPRTTTTYTDGPAAGVYYYIARAYYLNWESANSNEARASCCTISNTGLRSPTAQAADTGGDGDGYETNPTDAFSLNSTDAEDRDSGTNTSTSCTDAGKDRHRYYNYGFSIPANASINGIEVQATARVNNAAGTRLLCVQLSWDGGTSWTAAKTTSALTTSRVAYTLGAASDGWGRRWNNATDFTNANFRVRVIDVSDDPSMRFFLDYVGVRVTYTTP